MRTGSAAIHAAAVTAAAWMALPVLDVGQLRAGETRPRATARHRHVITHGFPVGELAASSSPTGKPWVITDRRTRPHCGLVRRTRFR